MTLLIGYAKDLQALHLEEILELLISGSTALFPLTIEEKTDVQVRYLVELNIQRICVVGLTIGLLHFPNHINQYHFPKIINCLSDVCIPL